MSVRSSAPVIGAAVLVLGAAIALQAARDRAYPRDVEQVRTILYVQSGPALRRMALEFDALASDLYWIRAIQHYGGERLAKDRPRNYDLLYPLLDITTSLDPFFTIAYRFGAIFLSEPYPGGPGRPDQAIALLRKGITAQPRWQYFHDIAFVHYWHLRDFKSAAAWFQQAAEQPNAPNWLAPLVASVLTAGGERQAARLIWGQMLQADQAWLRRTAARRLRQLDALDQIELIERLAAQVPPSPGERYSWEYLARRGVLRGIPLDPTGVPYAIDPATGRVSVSPRSELQPMPDEHAGRSQPR